ncbi:unnamed protein product [marine sediment metagenome]|uniref:Plasmid replication protein RepL domain-containing protein n=1 Tax=marine sediment metagenome TaxID=412755 RepID=X1QLX8_9ZZZZ
MKGSEINQGLEILNEAGEWVLGRKKEQIIAYAWGFMMSGIIRELNDSAVVVLNVICGFTGKKRNTIITNKKIAKYGGVSEHTVKNVLKELKFYHVISSHILPKGTLMRRRRSITVNRWDTALALLIKEKKIKLGLDNKVVFLVPNKYRK